MEHHASPFEDASGKYEGTVPGSVALPPNARWSGQHRADRLGRFWDSLVTDSVATSDVAGKMSFCP